MFFYDAVLGFRNLRHSPIRDFDKIFCPRGKVVIQWLEKNLFCHFVLVDNTHFWCSLAADKLSDAYYEQSLSDIFTRFVPHKSTYMVEGSPLYF